MGKNALSAGFRGECYTEGESPVSCVYFPLLLSSFAVYIITFIFSVICLSFPHSPLVLSVDCTVLRIITRLQVLVQITVVLSRGEISEPNKKAFFLTCNFSYTKADTFLQHKLAGFILFAFNFSMKESIQSHKTLHWAL